MRSVDGITSSKFSRALLKQPREHPIVFLSAIVLGVGAITALLWVSSFSAGFSPTLASTIPTTVAASSTTSQPQAPVIGLPSKLTIPSINIDATVESVGLTKNGEMDTPSNTNDVAWYQNGVRPGQNGNAVMNGHLDTIWLRPAVFANLDKLNVGDSLTVTDANGVVRTFKVQKVASYNVNNLPLQQIFGPSATPQLNLITCSGKWSWRIASYTERTVVYTTLAN